MNDNGRLELARRLHRIFVSQAPTGREVPDETVLGFADDLLAGDYTDHRWGRRKGDGGPRMKLIPDDDA